jgi:hypothetical protein
MNICGILCKKKTLSRVRVSDSSEKKQERLRDSELDAVIGTTICRLLAYVVGVLNMRTAHIAGKKKVL